MESTMGSKNFWSWISSGFFNKNTYQELKLEPTPYVTYPLSKHMFTWRAPHWAHCAHRMALAVHTAWRSLRTPHGAPWARTTKTVKKPLCEKKDEHLENQKTYLYPNYLFYFLNNLLFFSRVCHILLYFRIRRTLGRQSS